MSMRHIVSHGPGAADSSTSSRKLLVNRQLQQKTSANSRENRITQVGFTVAQQLVCSSRQQAETALDQ